MSNIWITSDWHLDHFNIIKFCNRPFLTVESMQDTIINNFVQLVFPNDKVYILGDLCYSLQTFLKLFDCLYDYGYSKTEFHFIRGNHDIKQIPNGYFKSISQIKDIKVNDQKITLCHYPMYSWNCSHWGAWLLHGHHHRDTSKLFKGKIYNVGVDENDFKPVSFEQIKEIMKYRELNWDDLTKSQIIRKENK